MRDILMVVCVVLIIVLAGCDETKTDLNTNQTLIDTSVTMQPSRYDGVISIDISAKVFSKSKAQALRRIAADLQRMADDLDPKPEAPPQPIGQLEVSQLP